MPSHGCRSGRVPTVAVMVLAVPTASWSTRTATVTPLTSRTPGPPGSAGPARCSPAAAPGTVSPEGGRSSCTPPPRRASSAATA